MTKRKSLHLFRLSVLLAVSTAVVAQETADQDPDESEEIEEIIVTTTRRPTRMADTANRIEVINQEELEEKVAMSPGDVVMLLSETSGLRVQMTAPGLGSANVRIQGLRGQYSQVLRGWPSALWRPDWEHRPIADTSA